MKSILLATALALTAIAPSLAATDSESRPQIKIHTDIKGEIAPGIKVKPLDTKALQQKLGDAPLSPGRPKKLTIYDINKLNVVSLCTGTMHEDLISTIYSADITNPSEYPLSVSYATDQLDLYIIQPYSNEHPLYELLNNNNLTSTTFNKTIIDASDHDYVVIQPFQTGVMANLGNGTENLVVVSADFILEALGYSKSVIQNADLAGINDNGHIYFPEGAMLATTMTFYNNFTIYGNINNIGNYFIDISNDGKWGLTIPNYNDFSVSSEQMCYDDDNITIDIATGAGISYIKATIFNSFDPDNYITETYNYGSQFLCDPNNPLKIEANAEPTDSYNNRVYFSVVALDSENKIVDADCIEIFLTADDASLWSEPVGAALTDGIVAPMYDELKVYSHDVKVQRLKSNPNYMRIVNPYSSPWTYACKNIFCKPASRDAESSAHNHNHYIYIDATDPSAVVLETSPIGFMIDSEEGEALVSSKAAIGIDSDGMTKEQMKAQGVTGTFANNSITFPANSLAFKTHKTSKEYYVTNPNGEFELRFFTSTGETTAVDTITTDNDAADAVYYNLQGVEISADKLTPGVYIRRQGNEAKKVLIK